MLDESEEGKEREGIIYSLKMQKQERARERKRFRVTP